MYRPNTPVESGRIPPGAAQGIAVQPDLAPMPMPELVQLAELMMGTRPVVGYLRGARGSMGPAGPGSIKINREIFTDPVAAAKTLAHEIGHLVDYLDDKTVNRGNLIGRVRGLAPVVDALGKLRGFMANVFPDGLGGPTNAELRKELIDLSKWWKPFDPTSNQDFTAYRHSAVELYADALSVWMNSPGLLEKRAPKFYRELMHHLDAKPGVVAAVNIVQDILHGTPAKLASARQARAELGYLKGEEAIRAAAALREESDQSIISYVNQLLIDSAGPTIDKEKALRRSGITIGDEQSAIFAMEELALKDNPAHLFLSDVQDHVDAKILAAGITREDAGWYLENMRIAKGDRTELANPRGTTPADAELNLKALADRLGPEKHAVLEAAIAELRERVFAVNEAAAAHHVYGKKVFETTILPNKDTYAPFAVVDYITDHMPAGIAEQVGTFKDIANPYLTLMMKTVSVIRAIELNKAKRTVIFDQLQVHFPGEVTVHKVEPGHRAPMAGHGMEMLPFMQDGRVAYAEVERSIARMFKTHDIGMLTRLSALVSSATYKIFHPLYVTWSVNWQVMNVPRDLKRTYTNLGAVVESAQKDAGAGVKAGFRSPGIVGELSSLMRLGKVSEAALGRAPTWAEMLRAYVKASPAAWKRARGVRDADIDAMLRDRSLDVPFTQRMDPTEDVPAVEKLMAQHGLGDAANKRWPGLLNAFKTAIDFVGDVGTWTETVPKLAAWKVLGERGIDGRRRAYAVRNFVGTPNTRRRAAGTTLANGLWMYSNVTIQGWRADGALALGRDPILPKTAGGWWLRTLAVELLPKLAMRGAALGMFGAAAKAWFDMIPDYDKTNFIVLPNPFQPVITDETGETKANYLRFPHADTARMIAGAFWHLSVGETPKTLAFTFGQLPGLNPAVAMGLKWIDYTQGRNPYDDFRKRDIVSRDAWEAGGWHAAREMLGYTADQFGAVSQLVRWATPRAGEEGQRTVTERVLQSVPGLSAISRQSNRGLSEGQWEAVDLQEAERARLKLDLPANVRPLLAEHYRLQRFNAGGDLRPEQAARYARLRGWYSGYLKITKAMRAANERGDRAEYSRLKAVLEQHTAATAAERSR